MALAAQVRVHRGEGVIEGVPVGMFALGGGCRGRAVLRVGQGAGKAPRPFAFANSLTVWSPSLILGLQAAHHPRQALDTSAPCNRRGTGNSAVGGIWRGRRPESAWRWTFPSFELQYIFEA